MTESSAPKNTPSGASLLPRFDQPANHNAKGARFGATGIMVAVGVAVAVAVAGLMFGFILPLNLANQSAVALVEHTREVIEAVGGVVASADEMETSQRGFLLTRDVAYLEPYDRDTKLVWQQLSTLRYLIVDNPRQKPNLDILSERLRNRLVVMSSTIELARRGDINGAIEIVKRGEGKSLMDDIRRVTGDIMAEEQRLLQRRRTEVLRMQQRSALVVVTLSVLLVVSFLLIALLVARAAIAGDTRKRLATEAAGRQRLLDMVNVAAVMLTEVDGTIRLWSEGCRRLYGYTAEQAVGQSVHELLQTVFPVSLVDIDATLLRQGAWSGELRHRTRDGVELIVSAGKTLHDYADGSGRLVVETLTDVSELRQTETKLRQSLAQFGSVVETAADGFVIASGDGQIQSVNRAMLGLFGYDRAEELIGRNLRVLMPAGDAMRHDGYIASHHSGAPPRVIGIPGRELVAVRRDGSEFPIDLSVSSFGTNGSYHLTGIIRDATARKQAEAALRDSEARMRQFIDSAPAAIAMFDTDMCYLAVSRRYMDDYRIDDQARATLIGCSHYAVFPEVPENWVAIHRRVLAGETLSADNEAFPRLDGNIDRVRWEMAPWYHADGTIGGAMLFSEDVTRQQIEKEQRSIIIEAAPIGIMIVNEAGTVTLANSPAELLFGYPRGTLIGRPVETLVPEGLRVALDAMPSQSTSEHDVQDMEQGRPFIGRKRDGSEVPIEILLNPVKTPRGRIVVASVFDVTERLRVAAAKEDAERLERIAIEATNAELDHLARHLAKARDRAERASRAKSRFLAGMSHELRTPLNGIMGYAHLLQMEGGLSPTQSERVDAMLAAGKHLLEMISCVLDLSEIEAEHVTLRAVAVDLQAIAAACLDLVRPPGEAKGLSLSLIVMPGTPREIVTDPARLRQVLVNLLGNAVKFTAQGSIKMRLGMSANGSALRIDVADTGPGVPAEQIQRLFEEFERSEPGINLEVEGAGLGLALSRQLAVLMGGRVGYNDNPGGGSVFWLELPIDNKTVSPPDGAATAELPGAPPVPLTQALHVLVVDDVLMNRDIASSFLRAAGHEVTCVESGAQAIEAVATRNFDVVLMDVRMPEMDGLEATRRIRKLGGAPGRMPIVALTAQAFTDQIAECREAGMDSHLAKPFDPDTLLAAVVHAVSARPRQDEDNPVSTPTIVPPRSIDPVIGIDLPVLTETKFDRTVALLAPEAVVTYLRTIAALGQVLLRGLREPDALTSNVSALAETAHKLAGSAGMFGFDRLASLSLRFEHAVEARSAETPALAEGLCMAIEATCEDIPTRVGFLSVEISNSI